MKGCFRQVLVVFGSLVAVTVQAAPVETFRYKCTPLGRGADKRYFSVMTVKKPRVLVENFFDNGLTGKVEREAAAVYKVEGPKGGNGKLADYLVLSAVKGIEGTVVDPLYISRDLLAGGTPSPYMGSSGMMALVGHGYGYEWKLCIRRF